MRIVPLVQLLILLFFFLLAGCLNPSGKDAIEKGVEPDNRQNMSAVPAIALSNFSQAYTEEGKLIVYFFYSPGCPSCRAVSEYVEGVGKKYEKETMWIGYNIQTQTGRDKYAELYRDFNLTFSRSGVPVMLVNNTVIWGQFEIRDGLEKKINNSVKI